MEFFKFITHAKHKLINRLKEPTIEILLFSHMYFIFYCCSLLFHIVILHKNLIVTHFCFLYYAIINWGLCIWKKYFTISVCNSCITMTNIIMSCHAHIRDMMGNKVSISQDESSTHFLWKTQGVTKKIGWWPDEDPTKGGGGGGGERQGETWEIHPFFTHSSWSFTLSFSVLAHVHLRHMQRRTLNFILFYFILFPCRTLLLERHSKTAHNLPPNPPPPPSRQTFFLAPFLFQFPRKFKFRGGLFPTTRN
jgi:hypothetical protein